MAISLPAPGIPVACPQSPELGDEVVEGRGGRKRVECVFIWVSQGTLRYLDVTGDSQMQVWLQHLILNPVMVMPIAKTGINYM